MSNLLIFLFFIFLFILFIFLTLDMHLSELSVSFPSLSHSCFSLSIILLDFNLSSVISSSLSVWCLIFGSLWLYCVAECVNISVFIIEQNILSWFGGWEANSCTLLHKMPLQTGLSLSTTRSNWDFYLFPEPWNSFLRQADPLLTTVLCWLPTNRKSLCHFARVETIHVLRGWPIFTSQL